MVSQYSSLILILITFSERYYSFSILTVLKTSSGYHLIRRTILTAVQSEIFEIGLKSDDSTDEPIDHIQNTSEDSSEGMEC